ncbi:uncharacterized protein LOC131874117 [Cryptomeria japonica]|uniref:uncharacterized protein LOC131874117 n=1 Tax=Cryptomeria japonica TaxID=3369 RepID=UPI0027DA28C2|nr:uncharacterized protein LOC131874117 [Cryptomeria japonica]
MPNQSPLLLLAPTGVATFNIGASTIHSKLRIPIQDFSQLEGTRLTTFQEELSYVKYILIDEMSFIGEKLLESIDSHLRQAFPQNSDLTFAGVSIILVGDLGQLPLVKDKPTYESSRRAKILWKKIYSLKQPIARSIAKKHGTVNATKGSSHDELDMELLISKNARVMLTSNLWIEAGLVNGALGYIQKIVYKPGSMPPEPPTYVMVKFDNYSIFLFDDRNPETVSISIRQRGSTVQIPLRLAWALTIHKSQGLTLAKATIDIGPTERTGMTFVAISHRVRYIYDISVDFGPLPLKLYRRSPVNGEQ